MAELGQLLRDTREGKGLSLAEAEKALRIRAGYLAALEAEDYDQLPGSVYVRGFLRNYSAFLGLEPGKLLAMYDSAHPSIPVSQVAPSYMSDVPLNVSLRWDNRMTLGKGLLAALFGVLLGVALWVGYIFLFADGQAPTLAFLRPAALHVPTATSPAPTMEPTKALQVGATEMVAATEEPAAPATTPTATRQSASPQATTRPSATPTITRTPFPLTSPGVTLGVEITSRSWMQVTLDGEEAYEGILEVGEKRTWEARERIILRVGNAGGVQVTLNGEALGPLGQPGQVMDREWFKPGDGTPIMTVAATGEVTPTATSTPAG